MVDSFNTPDAVVPAEVDAAPVKAGFLSTTLGKLIVGGLALVVILGAIAFVVTRFLFTTPEAPVGGIVTSPPAAVPATGTPDATPVEPDSIPLDETFTFRNIFAPSVKVTKSGSSGGSGTSSPTAPSSVPSNTLYLLDISVVDGEQTATFTWNGTEYIVGEGEQLGDTPWSVVSIDDTSATMLYGDTRVVISLGQGVSK